MSALAAVGLILGGIDAIVFVWFLGVGRVRG